MKSISTDFHHERYWTKDVWWSDEWIRTSEGEVGVTGKTVSNDAMMKRRWTKWRTSKRIKRAKNIICLAHTSTTPQQPHLYQRNRQFCVGAPRAQVRSSNDRKLSKESLCSNVFAIWARQRRPHQPPDHHRLEINLPHLISSWSSFTRLNISFHLECRPIDAIVVRHPKLRTECLALTFIRAVYLRHQGWQHAKECVIFQFVTDKTCESWFNDFVHQTAKKRTSFCIKNVYIQMLLAPPFTSLFCTRQFDSLVSSFK